MSKFPSLKRLSLSHTSVLRDRDHEGDANVTNLELFFDLVYVLTIIMLSEHLYEHPDLTGALQTLVMFSAVWWGWNYTAWATGWIDPQKGRVVVMMCVLMVLGIVTAAVIPEAFTEHGQTFAETYVAAQLVRNGCMVWAFNSEDEFDDPMQRNYTQLLVWSVLSGAVWIAGSCFHDPTTRLIVWCVAAGVDVVVPILGFWLPRLGTTPMSGWALAGGHLAERCQLILMIAFGETVLRLGESYAETNAAKWVNVSLVAGFILSASLWSLYFLRHAMAGAEQIEQASAHEAGTIGRSVYSYAHMALVGAVIPIAVAIHMAIEHPTDPVRLNYALLCLGGPVVYLLGLSLAKRWLGHGQFTHAVIGAVAMVVAGAIASLGPRWVLMVAAAAVAVALAIWVQAEYYAARRS